MTRIKNYTIVPALFLLGWCSACSVGENTVIISEIDRKEMVLIPAGEFIMGTNKVDTEETYKRIGGIEPFYLDQHPQRKVYLQAYYIDRYEVTNGEYQRFVEATQYDELPADWVDATFPEGMADHPVTNITWGEALTYALWARKQLPTEEQWEKAARGAEGRSYPWGEEFGKDFANIGIDGAKHSQPVGSYPKDVSPYQVYDMAGNVMEWTADWYQPYPGNDYHHPHFGTTSKTLRGSGFQRAGHYFLDAYRYAFSRTDSRPEEYFENVGFRTVAPIP